MTDLGFTVTTAYIAARNNGEKEIKISNSLEQEIVSVQSRSSGILYSIFNNKDRSEISPYVSLTSVFLPSGFCYTIVDHECSW